MAKREEALLSVSAEAFETSDVPVAERAALVPIIEESFQGLYRWHARRTLRKVQTVLAGRTPAGEYAGLIMLKTLGDGSGYVYYVAVLPRFRGRGLGGRLLDEAIDHFKRREVAEVYASAEEENTESKGLFASRGFKMLEGSEMQERYGRIRALLIYREMTFVPGEQLMSLRLKADSKVA
jgi:ribosomal protein S18 acetylase RimI-like enzyme